jgi:hypothetical protein
VDGFQSQPPTVRHRESRHRRLVLCEDVGRAQDDGLVLLCVPPELENNPRYQHSVEVDLESRTYEMLPWSAIGLGTLSASGEGYLSSM